MGMTPHHAPQKMTRAYNEMQAMMKVAIAPLEKLDARMLESISRTHNVPVLLLTAKVEERRAREGIAP